MTEDTQSLPLKDDLSIYTIELPDIPKDLIFPDEINRYFRERIKYLTHENGMLEKHLKEKSDVLEETTTQVKNLDVQLKKYQNSNTFVSSIELANSKIVELSKKVREKTSEIQAFKTKCSKLQKRILELQNDKNFELPKLIANDSIEKNEAEQTIKALQDKLNTISSKLFESKNANVQLKNDIKVANKLLQQEVGESLDVLQNNSNWRGRAQIICDLQEKNSELREKVKMFQDKGQVTKHNDSYWHGKSEKKIANLMHDNESLTQEIQETKKKLDSARSRCKYLDSELIVMKTKLKAANEQNERDNDRITTLTGQMAHLQSGQNENIKNIQKQQQKTETIIKSLKTELAKEKCLKENLQKDSSNKDAVINELKHEIGCGYSSTFSYDKQKNTEREVTRLEAERLRLLELVSLGNKRLEEERTLHSNATIQYLHERQKAAKLEARIGRLQLEQNSDRYSSYSGHSMTKHNPNKIRDESLLDRLELAEENMKVLSTRLNIERQEKVEDFNEFKKILLEREEKDENDEQ